MMRGESGSNSSPRCMAHRLSTSAHRGPSIDGAMRTRFAWRAGKSRRAAFPKMGGCRGWLSVSRRSRRRSAVDPACRSPLVSPTCSSIWAAARRSRSRTRGRSRRHANSASGIGAALPQEHLQHLQHLAERGLRRRPFRRINDAESRLHGSRSWFVHRQAIQSRRISLIFSWAVLSRILWNRRRKCRFQQRRPGAS